MSMFRNHIRGLLALCVLCLCSSGSLAQGNFTLGDVIYVDFGSSTNATPGNWNNMTNANGSVEIEDAITASGAITTVDFTLPDRSGGINENGTQEPDPALNLPMEATRDSFWGNDVLFSGVTEPTAQLVISGLDPSASYELTIFCSRMSVSDNRQTEYAITGSDGLMETLYLDPAENTDTDVTSGAIRPTTDGEIIVDIQKGPDNNNSYGFYYIGALSMRIVQNLAATQPTPANGATDVPLDVTMGWMVGQYAATHNVYFGTDADAVAAANADNPMDVRVSTGQTASTYTPDMALELGQTYYWRVDEVNGAPDYGVAAGEIWSFTTEPVSFPVTPIVATASSSFDEDSVAERTIDGSGLDELDQHSDETGDMWVSGRGDTNVWIQYEFATPQKLDAIYVWNCNQTIESLVGFSVKTATIETSLDGETWTAVADVPELPQGPGSPDYVYDTIVDLGGVTAQYVKLSIIDGWGDLGQYSLSEVRFMAIPTAARLPEPADGQTGVAVDTTLAWRAGREAAGHEVYVSTDEQAVTDGTAPVDTTTEASYMPADLVYGATYYWKVNEVNDAAAITGWEGSVWSFATAEYAAVDDFESYTDDGEAGGVIYLTWIDGWDNGTGSTVGHLEAPFAEQEIVHSGTQSMPLFYENSGTTVAEADFSLDQDWTANGITVLSIYFAGAEGNTGTMYVKINGTTITYDGDAAAMTDATWQVWNIDLAASGIDLSNVTSLTLGIEGSGASGVMYFDDIRLYPSMPE